MVASVIIASPGAAEIRALDEFQKQANERGAELIAVYTANGGVRAERVTATGREAINIDRPPGILTPHLWQAGIGASTGAIVVLTLNGLRPAAGWLKAHLDAHAAQSLGAVGGAIAPDDTGPLVDRAIAYSRYSAFIPPFTAHEVSDVAADNASYRREALACCADLMLDGFWEPPIHERLRTKGWKLALEPAALMIHESTNSFGSFIGQRLKHGFRFGADRRKSVTAGWLVKYLILSPAVPLVLTWRVFSRMKSKGRSTGEFLVIAPLLVCFNVAWTWGEVFGSIVGRSDAGK